MKKKAELEARVRALTARVLAADSLRNRILLVNALAALKAAR